MSSSSPSLYEKMASLFSKETFRDFLKTRASLDFDDPTTFPTLEKGAKKSSILFLFIVMAGVIVYYISTEKNMLGSKLYYYLILFMVPVILGIFVGKDLFMSQQQSETTTYEPFLKVAFYLLIAFAVFHVMENVAASSSTLAFMNYFINIVLVLMVITGLAIVYFIFSNYIKQQTGALGLFARILFYLPCLFADFVNYIKRELSITPSVVYVLLALEIVFVLLYVYLPRWVKQFEELNSYVLLKDPVDLNVETPIAGSHMFLASKLEEMSERPTFFDSIDKFIKRWRGGDKLTENQLYRRAPTYRDNNYSISFWAYVNAGSMSDAAYVREATILNYANGRPKISYVNNGTHKGNKYVIYLSNSPSAEPYEVVLDDGHQKWNYFAIVYHDKSADLFVNGKLIRTMVFNGTNLPRAGEEKDTIVVGSENGLKGAIRNVSYFPYPITAREIATAYNIKGFM